MRLAASVLFLACVSCGGRGAPERTTTARPVAMPADEQTVLTSSQRIVGRDPLDYHADTLYAEYVTVHHGREHRTLKLTGKLSCYGGPALDGNVPVEIYVRRAINRVAIVEDIVEIYPDDLIPRRRVVTMHRGPGTSPIRNGHALVEDEDGTKTVQAFKGRDGGIVLLAHDATPETMRVIIHVLDDDANIDLDALEEEDAWEALRSEIPALVREDSMMAIRGELPAIPADECATMFKHFPPPANARRSDRP